MDRLPIVHAAFLTALLLTSAGCSGAVTTSNGGSGGATGGTAGSGGASTGGGGTGGVTCTPSAELCDGMDNNCDGQVDEGCLCSQGETQSCYTGDAATKDKGACKSGTQTCNEQGAWGPCAGEVLPKTESCNNADDDCNGAADDLPGLSCGVGACTVMVPACANGLPNTCVPNMPAVEMCDGIDNNCNQLVDETFPNADKVCDTGLPGACAVGKTKCVTDAAGTSAKCVPDKMPGTEACDSVDNDCNGMVDDNIVGTGASCSTGLLGTCNAGTVSCQGGTIDCFPNNPPSPEVCDGLDNDCSGVADDFPGAGMACDTGLLGVCKDGINMCQNGVFGCVQQVQAVATDVCGDSKDNDCNGVVDQGCLYQFTGVQTNVPIASLLGWTQCYIDTYANTSTALTTIQTQCNKPKLLLGCRPTGSANLQVAAWAPRVDVLFDTGTGNVLHDANGVGWYYSSAYSWGFAPQGDIVTRSSCDTTASSFGPGADGDKRLCWHTGGGLINGGWRCGTADSLNGSTSYERIVYQAD